MKFYVLKALFVFCIIQYTSADWRDDLKEKHINRLAIFVEGLESLLKSIVEIKSTPAAWQCYNVAHEQYQDLISRHRSEIESCIAPNAEEPEAMTCSDKARKSALKEGATISNKANDCIDKS